MGRTNNTEEPAVSTNVNEVSAEVEANKILENAQETANKIIADAENRIKEMLDKAGATQPVATQAITGGQKKGLPDYIKKMQEDMKKDATITLFKDGDKYKDDVFISVNGTRRYQIQRGMAVNVPEFVKDINASSMKQDNQTAELMARRQAESENRYKEVNMTL